MVEVHIMCSDEEYGKALMDILCEDQRLRANVKFFSNTSCYQSQKGEEIYYISTLEDYAEWGTYLNSEKTLFLVKKQDECIYDFSVPKFSSVDIIILKLLEMMSLSGKVDSQIMASSSKKDAALIGFFSPVRRCSQTTLGVTIGNIMSETKRVLYMSFESFSNFWSCTGYQGTRSLEDLLLASKITPEKFGIYFNSVVYHSDSLDILPPIRSLQQILDVKAEDWVSLVEMIIRECDYDVIILDLSESIHGLLKLLSMCERIYTLTQEDPCAIAKINEYEILLRSCEQEEIIKKTYKKRIPFIEEIPNGYVYKPFSEFARYVKDMIMGDGLYAGICSD